MEYTFKDGLGPRDRRAWLVLVKEGNVLTFNGKDIPGVLAIKGFDYSGNGKWSFTTYRLQVAEGIRVIEGKDGWETGRFTEGLAQSLHVSTPDTWKELSQLLGISVVETIKFLEAFRPKEAKALHDVEEKLWNLSSDQPDSEETVQVVEVSFGGPTNRQIADGFWERPKAIPGWPAEVRRAENGEWYVVGMKGDIISASHIPGFHGGWYRLMVALVSGSEYPIPPFHTKLELEAQASEDPELYYIFKGDLEKMSTFCNNVAALKGLEVDRHEIACGRDRFRAEVLRASGNPEFFLGVDPLKLQGIVISAIDSEGPMAEEVPEDSEGPMAEEVPEDSEGPMAQALRKAGF